MRPSQSQLATSHVHSAPGRAKKRHFPVVRHQKNRSGRWVEFSLFLSQFPLSLGLSHSPASCDISLPTRRPSTPALLPLDPTSRKQCVPASSRLVRFYL